MSNLSIDEIIDKLSVKFNRIIYDREFVECVSADLEIIFKDNNKCCVLVFPILSPNYLRLLKYQVKLCDLSVLSFGSGNSKSIGVCQKKYVLTFEEDKKRIKNRIIMPQDQKMMAENNLSVRKKRPAIQLYVPPAQRKSKSLLLLNNNKIEEQKLIVNKTIIIDEPSPPPPPPKKEIISYYYNYDDFVYFLNNNEKYTIIPYLNDQCNFMKIFLFKKLLFPYAKLMIFSLQRIKKLLFYSMKSVLDKKILLLENYGDNYNNSSRFLPHRFQLFQGSSVNFKISVFVNECLDDFMDFSKLNEFNNNYCLNDMEKLIFLPDFGTVYFMVPKFMDSNIEDLTEDEKIFISSSTKRQLMKIYVEIDNLYNQIMMCDNNKETTTNLINNTKEVKEIDEKKSTVNNFNNKPLLFDHVIKLEERRESPKKRDMDEKCKNEHEQEKEIMRKTKKNINRKTRSIMKYSDDDNDRLNIDKVEANNVGNWEELFNDEGELPDHIFEEIVQKVGKNVTIVKANEDYSAYASKQLEELEHMVELYDFPATLETREIMGIFNEIDTTDSMYIKWVDDTHAILVLGSYSQAQKAIEHSCNLIKVRPMSCASNLTLEKAYQCDLKPAIKRPQTNLLTARRLITSHLGAKSKISKEQTAKEREDLRIAKELKRQAKQNEKDAWEGNIIHSSSTYNNNNNNN